MIVCRNCGSHNADGDAFCGSCGQFLEWTGEKVETTSAAPATTVAPATVPPSSSAPPATSAPPSSSPPPADPVPPLTAPDSAPAARPAAPPVPDRDRTPAATEFTPAVSAANSVTPKFRPAVSGPPPAGPQQRPPAGPEPDQNPATALVAPPPEVAPTRRSSSAPAGRKPQPEAVIPQAPAPRRPAAPPPTPEPPTRRLRPDDLICGNCGEGNSPDRRFCSRCGTSLQTATVVPTPWWQQIPRFFQRRVRPAGSRPKRRPALLTFRGVMSLIRRALIVAVLLLGLLYAVFPSMRSAVNGGVLALRDRVQAMFVQQYDPVRPIASNAVGELPGHTPRMATDQLTNTYWAAPDVGVEPTLLLDFERPTNLERAIVHNGAAEDDFGALSRPRQLHIVYFAEGKVIGTADAQLQDTPEKQEITFGGGPGATHVEIHIVDVYHSAQDSGAVGLSEIELFERRS